MKRIAPFTTKDGPYRGDRPLLRMKCVVRKSGPLHQEGTGMEVSATTATEGFVVTTGQRKDSSLPDDNGAGKIPAGEIKSETTRTADFEHLLPQLRGGISDRLSDQGIDGNHMAHQRSLIVDEHGVRAKTLVKVRDVILLHDLAMVVEAACLPVLPRAGCRNILCGLGMLEGGERDKIQG